LEIIYLKEIDSTHNYLISQLKEKKLSPPVSVIADIQSLGVGSRGNSWISLEGNIFLSFAFDNSFLPKDLPMVSRSIYFSFLMKETLKEFGSDVWLKWPNDFYIEDKKVGGTITRVFQNYTLSSMGINLKKAPDGFEKLDISTDKFSIVKKFFINCELNNSWKEIFRKFQVEFERSKEFSFHEEDTKISMRDALLNSDGSITVNKKRIYNLR